MLHSPHYTHPLRWRGPLVVTLHDATFFSDPEWHTRAKGPFFRTATRLAVRRADVCVVASQATADELERRLRAPTGPARGRPSRRGHQAVPAAVGRGRRAEVRSSLGLRPEEDYIAFLGTLEPRKNVAGADPGLVPACADRPDPPALVLAGGAGWDDRRWTRWWPRCRPSCG